MPSITHLVINVLGMITVGMTEDGMMIADAIIGVTVTTTEIVVDHHPTDLVEAAVAEAIQITALVVEVVATVMIVIGIMITDQPVATVTETMVGEEEVVAEVDLGFMVAEVMMIVTDQEEAVVAAEDQVPATKAMEVVAEVEEEPEMITAKDMTVTETVTEEAAAAGEMIAIDLVASGIFGLATVA